MALLATPSLNGVVFPPSAASPRLTRTRPSSAHASVAVMQFRRGPGRRCAPLPVLIPGRVRVVFPESPSSSRRGHWDEPSSPAPAPPPKSSPDTPEGSLEQAQAGEGQDQTRAGEGGTREGAEEWRSSGEARQWRSRPSSACGPWGARTPVYLDLLGPWFPGERSLEQMLGSVDRMLGTMVGPAWAKWGSTQQQQLGGLMALALRRPWDVSETPSAYTLSFDLPGLGKDDVLVTVDPSRVLCIKAEKKGSEAGNDASPGPLPRRFQTQIGLPKDVKKDAVSAQMKDGVLTVTVPKISADEPPEGAVQVPVV